MSHHWHPVLLLIFNLMSTYRSTYQPQTSKYLTMWVSTKVISPPLFTPLSVSRSGELVPEFSAGFPDNVTVQRESAAFLDCPVKNPGDRPVSYPLVNIILVIRFSIIFPSIADLLGENPRLAHSDQRPGQVLHGWQVQCALQRGIIQLGSAGDLIIIIIIISYQLTTNPHPDQIKFVQDRDGGIYECQVSTSTGTISRRVQLNVVYPEAYIKVRSRGQAACSVQHV